VKVTWALLGFQLCFSAVFGQDLVERIDNWSLIDWERMVVRTSGQSAPLSDSPQGTERIEALETAKAAAVKRLFDAVQNLRIDAKSTVRDAIAVKQVSAAVVRNVVEGFTIVDTRSMSDMSVEMDVEFPITGQFTSLLLPDNMGQGRLHLNDQPLCPTCLDPWPQDRKVPDGVEVIIPSEGFRTREGRPFTGLIIDARGFDLRPAVAPKVLNGTEVEIYGTKYSSHEITSKRGLVVYKRDLLSAIKDARAGSEPLIVRAVGVAGKLNTDIIISNNDALLVHAAVKKQNFLKECKVIIVLG